MALTPNFGGDIAGFGQSSKRGQKAQIFPARVKDIILQPSTDSNSLFAQNKGYPSIGFISFHPLYSVVDSQNKANLVAAPMDVNIRRLPLINEIVLIIQSTDVLNTDPQSQKFYYLNNVNVWNSIHHNSFPDLQNLSATQKSEVLLGYSDTQNGITGKKDDSPKDLYLGNTFIEDPQIRNLYPVEGDTIIEGRFGNSIRFSHTAIFPSQSVVSPWSKSGKNTQPITIIRNGQTKNTPSIRWTPIFEDIDGDASSIYLTNGQEINMTLASKNLASYNMVVTSSAAVVQIPNVVTQPQNQPLLESDAEELELATSQSLKDTPAELTRPVTASIAATASQAPNNSTTAATIPTSSVNPSPEKTPTSGPGSSKYEPIPESKLGPLTWAGEEIQALDYKEDYATVVEDESQYWDQNPPTLAISPELEKFILPTPPPPPAGSSYTPGATTTEVNLTPAQLEQAKALAARSGLDIVPGNYTNNAGKSISLAVVGSQVVELEVAKAFIVMAAAAKAAGVNIRVSSGYRPPVTPVNCKSSKGIDLKFTAQYQLRTVDRWTGKCGVYNENQRMNAGASCFHPATAAPGRSKHGDGIAIDINTGGFSSTLPGTGALTNVFVWMALNGWKYGFVRTVSTETWHWEYHPQLAKQGPYAKLGGKPDANFKRTMALGNVTYDLGNIKVA
jgi:LAS superfamily LD-carboxypeptidase LdcB